MLVKFLLMEGDLQMPRSKERKCFGRTTKVNNYVGAIDSKLFYAALQRLRGSGRYRLNA